MPSLPTASRAIHPVVAPGTTSVTVWANAGPAGGALKRPPTLHVRIGPRGAERRATETEKRDVTAARSSTSRVHPHTDEFEKLARSTEQALTALALMASCAGSLCLFAFGVGWSPSSGFLGVWLTLSALGAPLGFWIHRVIKPLFWN